MDKIPLTLVNKFYFHYGALPQLSEIHGTRSQTMPEKLGQIKQTCLKSDEENKPHKLGENLDEVTKA